MLWLLFLLSACDAPTDAPQLVDASLSCQETTGAWTLEATVDHDGGADQVATVHFDLEILFRTDGFQDAQYIGSHSLQHEGDGAWSLEVGALNTQLDCGFEGEYRVTITAEDVDGSQAAVAIVVDGVGTRLE